MAGFFSDVGPIRTAFDGRCSAQVQGSPRAKRSPSGDAVFVDDVEEGVGRLELHLASVKLLETSDEEDTTTGDYYVRSRRFEVLRCLHFLGWTRGHRTMSGVVSFSISSCFGPRRCSAQASAACI